MIVNGIEVGDSEISPGEYLDALSKRIGKLPETPDGAPVVSKATTSLSPRSPLPVEIMKALATEVGIPWMDGYEERVVAWWASDGRVDRDGDIIVPEGWSLEHYRANPVHLWNHDWSSVPIGMSLRSEVVAREDGTALALDILYPREEVWPFSERVHRLIRTGFLKTGSVGFLAKKIITVTDEAARQALGLGRWGVVVAEAELVEFSATPIPSNVGAQVSLLRSCKGLTAGDANIVRELGRIEAISAGKSEAAWKSMDAAMVAAWKLFFPGEKFPDAKGIDSPIEMTEPAGEVVAGEFVSDDSEIMKRLDNIEALVREIHSGIGSGKSEESESDMTTVLRELSRAV